MRGRIFADGDKVFGVRWNTGDMMPATVLSYAGCGRYAVEFDDGSKTTLNWHNKQITKVQHNSNKGTLPGRSASSSPQRSASSSPQLPLSSNNPSPALPLPNQGIPPGTMSPAASPSGPMSQTASQPGPALSQGTKCRKKLKPIIYINGVEPGNVKQGLPPSPHKPQAVALSSTDTSPHKPQAVALSSTDTFPLNTKPILIKNHAYPNNIDPIDDPYAFKGDDNEFGGFVEPWFNKEDNSDDELFRASSFCVDNNDEDSDVPNLKHSSRDDVCTSASSSDFAFKFKAAFSAQANLKPVNLKTSSSSTAAAASDRVITAELDVDGSKYVLDREVLRLETFCDRVAQVTGVDKTKLIKYSYIFDNDTFMFTANDSFGLETFLGRRVTCFSIHTKGTGSRQNSGCRKARPTELAGIKEKMMYQKETVMSAMRYREYSNSNSKTERLEKDRKLLQEVCSSESAGTLYVNRGLILCPLCPSELTPKDGGGLTSLWQHIRLHCKSKNTSVAKNMLRNYSLKLKKEQLTSEERKEFKTKVPQYELFTEIELSKFKNHSKDPRFCDLKVIERLQNGDKNPFKDKKKYSAMDYFEVKKRRV